MADADVRPGDLVYGGGRIGRVERLLPPAKRRDGSLRGRRASVRWLTGLSRWNNAVTAMDVANLRVLSPRRRTPPAFFPLEPGVP